MPLTPKRTLVLILVGFCIGLRLCAQQPVTSSAQWEGVLRDTAGSPFVYTVAVAPPYFSGGPHIVNMGLPANTLLGSGFGEISRTAGTSSQIQFFLKLIY